MNFFYSGSLCMARVPPPPLKRRQTGPRAGMAGKLLIGLLLLGLPQVTALVLSGRVAATPHPYSPDSSDKLHFIGKFCFSNQEPHAGTVTLETKVRAGSKGTHVLLFDDTKWPAMWARRDSITCHEAISNADSAGFQDEADWVQGLPIGVSRHSMVLNNVIRPHYWYAAAINCNGPLDLSYTMTFTQPDSSQMSFDLQGCETAYSLLGAAMILLMVAHGQAHRWQVPRGYGMTRLTSASLALIIVACLLKMTHLNLMAKNGAGAPFLDGCADLVHGTAFVIIAGVFLLAAHGWATVHSRVQSSGIL